MHSICDMIGKTLERGKIMLHLLLGRDWTANRDAVMKRLAADVHQKLSGRILMVPELISHETERRGAFLYPSCPPGG